MTYDPSYHYEEDQRNQRRYNSLLPVFLVAIVLLVAFGSGFVAYQRHRTKPAKVVPYTVREALEVGNPGTVWIKCNAGMDVADLKNCPGYGEGYRNGARDASVILEFAAGHRLKLHKRKAEDAPKWSTEAPPAFSDRWKANEYDQLALDHDQVFYDDVFVPQNDNCTDRERYRQLQCMSDGKCNERNKDVKTWCDWGPITTTPQDITNLMEQIAPTPTQYICRKAGECFPKCDSPLTPWITRACYQVGFRGEKTLVLPSNYAHGFTCPDEFESCWVVNSTIDVPHEHQPVVEWHIDPPAKRDCKMPADVDVCPDTIDPKNADDKKGKP